VSRGHKKGEEGSKGRGKGMMEKSRYEKSIRHQHVVKKRGRVGKGRVLGIRKEGPIKGGRAGADQVTNWELRHAITNAPRMGKQMMTLMPPCSEVVQKVIRKGGSCRKEEGERERTQKRTD